MKRKLTLLRHETLRYNDLIGILRSRRDAEVYEIPIHIRAAEDSLRVLYALREAEIIPPPAHCLLVPVSNRRPLSVGKL